MMATRIPNGLSYICENGSHMAMYDDQEAYFEALLRFLSSI
jgi:proline iminopeptidase